ncbi:MAG: serine--tRNA ligase [Candidatus Levybacteria bacterium CG_4_10_14_0_8_um_filter_35_23]|nr:MAG: serine--tRNA ligase [Candidatus Levybacteria bacterium CG_4_10_14_0_8_um_filter_35_23]
MLDIKFIRENTKFVVDGAKNKGVEIDGEKLLKMDEQARELNFQVQNLREEKNTAAKNKDIEKGKKVKQELEEKEKKFNKLNQELNDLLLQIPNPAKKDVKSGKNDTENDVLRKVGIPKKFNFVPKDHLALGEALDVIDVERASKISGSRFYFLKNEAVLLEFALKQFAFETLLKEGFIPVLPPVLIKTEVMKGLGYMENGGDEDMYIFEKDDLVLVGTSEQSIVAMHRDEVLSIKDMPKRYVGFSTCFRREAGSYGKDTKGILRAHQFDKIEMVSFVKQGEDDKEHEFLLSLEEKLLKALDIPYQVIKMCTGDLGFPAARKYDLEGWIPSQNKYRELTSASTTTDFQARRLRIRYKNGEKTEYVNILNGTAFSTRPIIAIMENYQQEDGSIIIPEILRKWVGKDKITLKD